MHSNDLEAYGMKCCSFWFHSEVKFLTRFWRLFWLSHFALFQCNFYRFLCCKVFNLHLFCVISMFVSGRCLYKRFKCFKNFNEFSMYLFRWRKRGCTNACICMGTHSQPLLQNPLRTVLVVYLSVPFLLKSSYTLCLNCMHEIVCEVKTRLILWKYQVILVIALYL